MCLIGFGVNRIDASIKINENILISIKFYLKNFLKQMNARYMIALVQVAIYKVIKKILFL